MKLIEAESQKLNSRYGVTLFTKTETIFSLL